MERPQYGIALITSISSSEITKSNTLVLSAIREGVTDFGKGMMPFYFCGSILRFHAACSPDEIQSD